MLSLLKKFPEVQTEQKLAFWQSEQVRGHSLQVLKEISA